MRTITPQALSEKSGDQAIELIDVRTPVEFQEVHIDGAKNIPLDSLDVKALLESRGDSCSDPIYVICRSGMRGGKACDKFLAAGFQEVVNVDGGVMAWEAANFPVIRGKKVMSLERQVRIAAGFLVFSGAALGHFVHDGFFVVPAFVGAGLMFAGITNSCAMGMLIAKMPWNQVKTCNAAG
jgi:rhodanese-related sulfurtransferase